MAETPFGPAGPSIQDYVNSARVDLVVMTTHGRGGLVRAALGSVTDQLIRGAAPVLIVREPAIERSAGGPLPEKGRP
jgi:nucleotide-binding universal stress UspA family protein